MLDAKDSIGVVSVLEGGYSLAAPKQSTKDKKLSNQLATASVASTRGGGRGSNTVPAVVTAASEVVDFTRKYAQLPGDGGLVKRSQRVFNLLKLRFLTNYIFEYVPQCFGAHCSFGRLRRMGYLKTNTFETTT